MKHRSYKMIQQNFGGSSGGGGGIAVAGEMYSSRRCGKKYIFGKYCKDSKYKVNSAIQHLNKVMGEIFGGGGTGGRRVGPTYSSRRRRRRKNNLFAKDFEKR